MPLSDLNPELTPSGYPTYLTQNFKFTREFLTSIPWYSLPTNESSSDYQHKSSVFFKKYSILKLTGEIVVSNFWEKAPAPILVDCTYLKYKGFCKLERNKVFFDLDALGVLEAKNINIWVKKTS